MEVMSMMCTISVAGQSATISRVCEACPTSCRRDAHSCDAPARTMSHKNDKNHNCNKIIAKSPLLIAACAGLCVCVLKYMCGGDPRRFIYEDMKIRRLAKHWMKNVYGGGRDAFKVDGRFDDDDINAKILTNTCL